MNYSVIVDAVSIRNDRIMEVAERLATLLIRIGEAKRAVYEAQLAYDNGLTLAIYRESQKGAGNKLDGKNAEDRKLAREAFEIALRQGELKGLAAVLEVETRAKIELESEIAALQASFEAMKIAQTGDVAILNCRA